MRLDYICQRCNSRDCIVCNRCNECLKVISGSIKGDICECERDDKSGELVYEVEHKDSKPVHECGNCGKLDDECTCCGTCGYASCTCY